MRRDYAGVQGIYNWPIRWTIFSLMVESARGRPGGEVSARRDRWELARQLTGIQYGLLVDDNVGRVCARPGHAGRDRRRVGLEDDAAHVSGLASARVSTCV